MQQVATVKKIILAGLMTTLAIGSRIYAAAEKSPDEQKKIAYVINIIETKYNIAIDQFKDLPVDRQDEILDTLIDDIVEGKLIISIDQFESFPDGLQNNIVDKLVKEKGHCYMCRNFATQALFYAIRHNLPWAIKPLIKREADFNPRLHHSGCLPLCYAAVNGHDEIVSLLLDAKANIEGIDDHDDSTALYFAAKEGHGDTVQLLLQKKAAIDKTGRKSALQYAVANGHTEVTRLLIDTYRDKFTMQCPISSEVQAKGTVQTPGSLEAILPGEVLDEIFKLFTCKELGVFRTVCSGWRACAHPIFKQKKNELVAEKLKRLLCPVLEKIGSKELVASEKNQNAIALLQQKFERAKAFDLFRPSADHVGQKADLVASEHPEVVQTQEWALLQPWNGMECTIPPICHCS